MNKLYYICHVDEGDVLLQLNGEFFYNLNDAINCAKNMKGKTIIWEKVGRIRTNRPKNLPDIIQFKQSWIEKIIYDIKRNIAKIFR